MLKAAEVRKKALLAWCFFLSLSLSFFRFSCFWLLISFQFIPFTSSPDALPLLPAGAISDSGGCWYAIHALVFGRSKVLIFWEHVPFLHGGGSAMSYGAVCFKAYQPEPFCFSVARLKGSKENLKLSCLDLVTSLDLWRRTLILFDLQHTKWLGPQTLRVHQLCNIVHTQYHQYLSVWLPRSQVTKNQRRVETIPAAARISVSCDTLRGTDRCFAQGSQGDLVYEVGLWKICETSNVEAMWIVNLRRLTRKAQQDAQEVQKLRAELDTLQKWDVKSDFALFWAQNGFVWK